jgi:hypothetical protein
MYDANFTKISTAQFEQKTPIFFTQNISGENIFKTIKLVPGHRGKCANILPIPVALIFAAVASG